ncbi:serine hydrolase [Chryseobacterium populi]|uniref:Penicillin-binding protein, beta-lactamase class C n=1 Tax=Chryseobacterium populi TaxID=1144316 RepID=J3CHH6_9FLAO|nr:serine hydrolase [Chryseobacterium populi]EJL71496.1 penicillin-binding protein, beta-lactamase class C [Chryseobacterium populi]
MKKLLSIIFLISGFSAFAQKTITEKQIYASMNAQAEKFLKETKANSFSIGIVKDGKTYTRHYGEIDKGKGNKANNSTLFEIASITKLFTGALIAKAVLDGKIKLNDDIRKYITGSYPNLEFKGISVTIKDLVSLKSGFNKDLPDRSELFQNRNDSIAFKIEKLEKSYTKEQFFNDLKAIKVETVPGTVYNYNNGTLQLSAHILENVYGKSYETLLKENLISPLKLAHTKLHINQNETIANGYDENGVMMPFLPYSLWGAQGYLKSTLTDLTTFLKFELDKKSPLVQESQRDLLNNKNYWNAYFWDEVTINHNGRNARKHGGAFGTQNLFWVFPDYDMGISVITNQSGDNTYGNLYNSVQYLVDDLKPFGQKLIGREIERKCFENIDTGIAYYKDLKKNKPDSYNFSDESELNSLGYKLMRSGKITSSIKLFQLYVSEFPDSGNSYDSLAEAYFNNKEFALSKQNYQKSLELNPENTNAKDMLAKIEKEVEK